MKTPILEVTITHNLEDPSETRQLLKRRLIAIDYGRKWKETGTDPKRFKGQSSKALRLFEKMRLVGAAVLAAYKGSMDKPEHRLVGVVAPDSEYQHFRGLLCLKLKKHQVVDVSTNFMGNLTPRQCTIQSCEKRAKGRLIQIAMGTPMNRDIGRLHFHDVENLVHNYLITSGLCEVVWTGGRCFENIDHAGVDRRGREVLAQTTVSSGADLVEKKAVGLLELKQPKRTLIFFGPASAKSSCPKGIKYVEIEKVFGELDRSRSGRWLIDRMIGTGRSARRSP